MSGATGGAGRGGTPATVALTAAAVAFELRAYDVRTEDHQSSSRSYGAEAAEALGVPAEAVFKTLVARVDGRLTMAVVPVSGALDLKALALAVGGKRAIMAEPADAERATGSVVGGISPVGSRTALPVVVDDSALGLERMWVSAGRRGLQVSLAPADLVAVTSARTAPIRRGR